MIVQTNYNWNQAKASRFNADKIRKCATRIPRNQNLQEFRVVITQDHSVSELKEWFSDNELTPKDYRMFGLFDDRKEKMYFHGLAFEFVDSDMAMFFKLRFM
jgi:hypothetical protein